MAHSGFVPTVAHVMAARRRLAQRHLLDFAGAIIPDYQRADHHRLICDRLEALERGDIDRLMIAMPPRHGKSQLASRLFPAWCMGRNPKTQIIAASYNSDLASDFGRDVRNIVGSPEFGNVFPGVSLAVDSKAANRMNTNMGGAYIAAGVGTAVTGRGARIAIIDDPFKDREEADSERTREKVWAWYQSTLYTRLMPGGAICVVNCLTGDTPVLMGDGSEKPISSLAVGDMVLSFDGIRMKPQKVVNWANQGSDYTFEIKMKSGKTVRANERHPFLVEKHGVTAWARVRSLTIGDKVHALKDIGENGEVYLAQSTDARFPPDAKVCAAPITIKPTGPVDTDRHQQTTHQTETHTCDTDTGLILSNMSACLPSNLACVLFASSRAIAEGEPLSIAGISASTIATKRVKSEGCFATPATLELGILKTRPQPSRQHNICVTILDEIVSITPCGKEDVFDIQVEGTSNFIANGLLSHNTRWHEDDLSGRLLNGSDKWEVLELPAINTNGEALWPEWYDVPALERIKANIGPREWSALYQQKPQPDEGTYFQRDWLKSWQEKPKALNIYGTSDYAVTDGGGDYTVHRVWGVDEGGDLYRLDGWRGQTSADVWIDRKLDLVAKWNPLAWFGEAGVIQKAIEPMLRRRMQERKVFCRLEFLSSITDKASRARGFQARAAMGKVWFEPGADLGEFLMFPAGKHDDDVDNASMIGRAIDETHPAIIKTVVRSNEPSDRYHRASPSQGSGSAWG